MGVVFRRTFFKCRLRSFSLAGLDINSDMVCCEIPYPEEGYRLGMRWDRRRPFVFGKMKPMTLWTTSMFLLFFETK